jgi:hypothetical protein
MDHYLRDMDRDSWFFSLESVAVSRKTENQLINLANNIENPQGILFYKVFPLQL